MMKGARLLVSAILITGVLLIVGALVIIFGEESAGKDGLSPGRELLSNASKSEDECVVCHSNHTPGIVAQYGDSDHFKNNVSCSSCHEVDEEYAGATQHPDQDFYVLAKSSPAKCETCHEREVNQFNLSRHALPAYVAYAGTDPLSEDHLALYGSIAEGGFLDVRHERNAIHNLEGETVTKFACETCHDVGKPNPDQSVGDCTACHLRHEFSIEQVRKPETCNACHIGPDHPQWEIYHESPHGIAYSTTGDDWNWDAEAGTLTTADFPAPTCQTCHFSGFGSAGTTHDVGDRLGWYLFAPISARRPNAAENVQEMQLVCEACHSSNYIDTFYGNGDALVASINDWVKLSDAMVAPLKENGLLTARPFDEEIDYVYYEIWHHWGRTAKFGAWMQGPDYTQWHGAYELMKDLVTLRDMVNEKLEAAGLPPLDLPETFPSLDSAQEYLARPEETPASTVAPVEPPESPTEEATEAATPEATEEMTSEASVEPSVEASPEATSEN